jgi:hypothetical protein
VTVGFVFCVLPGIYVGLIWAFTVPVMVAESRFGTAAMTRSAELALQPAAQVRLNPRLHVFVTVMVGTMLGYMINLLVQTPFILYQQWVVFRDMAGVQKADPTEMMARLTWVQVPAQMLGMLTNTAVHLYVCFGLALLFFDLKSRKEGLDLETWRWRTSSSATARAATAVTAPPTSTSSRVLQETGVDQAARDPSWSAYLYALLEGLRGLAEAAIAEPARPSQTCPPEWALRWAWWRSRW